MHRALAEYLVMLILLNMEFLKPFVNSEADKVHWQEAIEFIGSVVFKDLPGDEEYG